MSKILFVVESPFQLISAMEARNHFRDEYAILVLKYSGYPHKNTDAQLQKIKEIGSFDEVVEIRPVSGFLEANLRLLGILKGYRTRKNDFSKIFIGEYRSWYHRKFLSVLKPKENYVLDDGSVTIALQKDYFPYEKPYDLSRGLKKYFRSSYFKFLSLLFPGSGDDFYGLINLFTCFNLEPYDKKQKIIIHNFPYIRKYGSRKRVDASEIYFFGGNLSGLNLLTTEQEISLLTKIVERYKLQGKNMIYVAHRRESPAKLDLIRDQCRVEVVAFDNPAEIQFLLMESHPYGIASFVSTALFTVSKMFDFSSVESFYLPMENMPEVNRKAYISVYNEYGKTMKLINLLDAIGA